MCASAAWCPEPAPGDGNERLRGWLPVALPSLDRPGPVPPAAATRDTGALSSQIRLCLHCNQSLTYCKSSMLWFWVCWVFLSAAGQKESSNPPGVTQDAGGPSTPPPHPQVCETSRLHYYLTWILGILKTHPGNSTESNAERAANH